MVLASERSCRKPGNDVKIVLRLEDVDNRELLQNLLLAMYEELPAVKFK